MSMVDTTPSFNSQVMVGGTVDGNAPTLRNRKAKVLNMSVAHRFHSDYPVTAVIASFRGSKEDANHAFPLNGSASHISESAKHGKFGD